MRKILIALILILNCSNCLAEQPLPILDSRILLNEFSLSDGVYSHKNGNRIIIRSQIQDKETAAKLLKNKLVQLKLLFAPQKASYPGMLTKDQSCISVASFPEKIQRDAERLYWSAELPATEDYFYGSCGSRAEPFWSQYQVLYCKKSKILFDIKYFVPKDKNLIKSSIGYQMASCPRGQE